MHRPDIHYKVRIEEEGKPMRFAFITRQQASTRGLLAKVLKGEAAEYVKTGPAQYKLLRDWKRDHRIT